MKADHEFLKSSIEFTVRYWSLLNKIQNENEFVSFTCDDIISQGYRYSSYPTTQRGENWEGRCKRNRKSKGESKKVIKKELIW